MHRIKAVGLAAVGALGLSVTGMVGGGTAHADTASDLQTVVANAPDAAQVLVDQLQIAVDHFQATNSVDGLVNDLGQALNITGGVLGQGTEQFGSLGLGLALATLGPYQVIAPLIIAFDNDPASVADQLDPADLATILGNVPAAVDAVVPQVKALVADLLEGNLIAGTGLFDATAQPGVVGDVLATVNALLVGLFAGTAYEANIGFTTVGVGVAAIVLASYIQQAEDGLAPVFEALAPVTAPIIAALQG